MRIVEMRRYRKRIDVRRGGLPQSGSRVPDSIRPSVAVPLRALQRAVGELNRERGRTRTAARISSLKHSFKRAAGAGPYPDFSAFCRHCFATLNDGCGRLTVIAIHS
ncbi:hypothetical protein [Burkholderia pseudomultivorans]|uniref:hypothetical protein n=1 Tax=Burkholderia pseudomultivorans TaxID=1207504 RepID=UPI0015828EE3|nr:hypothetical protein [Burkholderia pseudomultivorans]